MGEFTQTPPVHRSMNFSNDTEVKDVETEAPETTDKNPDTEMAKGAEAAVAQGTQSSQTTSAEAEGETEAETATEVETKTEKPKKQYATDVADVKCDDQVRVGTDKFPCFDVTRDEFYQNMQDGRRRLRFERGSNCQKYMAGTKYNRAFFVRHTDERGKTYVRKIK
jgi:hypothetical protein